MGEASDRDGLKMLVLAALAEADRRDETLVACFLAQALDAIERRLDAVAV
jgi:hypothetical protein